MAAENRFYHDTWKLLKSYRDVTWSVEAAGFDLQLEFREQFGTDLDDYLETLQYAGADLTGTKVESHARSLERSRKMLRIIDQAIDLMRRRHKKGELYYWTLYYTFLSPHEYQNQEAILQALSAHFPRIERRAYFRNRQMAVEILSSILWGYASRESIAALDEFALETATMEE